MRDPKDFTIAALCVSACILATVLGLMYLTPPAYAEGSIRGGDYIIVNGSVTDSIDLIYIVDVAQQKLNVYVTDAVQNQIFLRDQLNLKLEFKPE